MFHKFAKSIALALSVSGASSAAFAAPAFQLPFPSDLRAENKPADVRTLNRVGSVAPNLSYERVIMIASTNNPNGESIAPGQTTTAVDEGGAQMEISVLEMGYGTSTPYITMNGAEVNNSMIESRQEVCETSSGVLALPCTAGETMVGTYYIINLSGYQSGKFTFYNRSINNLSVTATTSLNIL